MPANERRAERLTRVRELKGSVCADCGGTFEPTDLFFHHLDPASKRFNLSDWPKLTGERGSVESLEAEAAKCVVLCRSCNAVRLRARPRRAKKAKRTHPRQKHGAQSKQALRYARLGVRNRWLANADVSADELPAHVSNFLDDFASVQAKIDLLDAWLDEHGVIDEETGDLSAPVKLVIGLQNSAARSLARLSPVWDAWLKERYWAQDRWKKDKHSAAQSAELAAIRELVGKREADFLAQMEAHLPRLGRLDEAELRQLVGLLKDAEAEWQDEDEPGSPPLLDMRRLDYWEQEKLDELLKVVDAPYDEDDEAERTFDDEQEPDQ